ncbi:MAG: hypothetical protein J6W74_03285 [Bacteroidales bacterium]|nr:hypothetical protein [Bacteroidales bacterium]
MNRLLAKLLLAKLSAFQFAGFVAANIIGATIILLGVRAYADFSTTMEDPQGAIANNYIVIAPPVSTVTTAMQATGFNDGPKSFTEEEIEEISSLEGVEDAAIFRSANFKVNASFALGGSRWETVMFVESVPDRFLDLDLDSWTASLDSETTVPVVLPKAYLNVLNYAVSASRGDIPQIGEGLVKTVPITLRFRGQGMEGFYSARVVGFTDRINTILVPEDFLIAAVKKYGNPKSPAPVSRMILKPSGKDDNGLLEYLAEGGYVFDGSGQDSFKVVTLAKGIALFAIVQGLLISLLAFFLLVVSIHLLIEKNREKNASLIMLGYTRREVSKPYIMASMVLDAVSLIVATILANFLYRFFERILVNYNPEFAGTGTGIVFAVAAGMFVFFSAVHYLLVRSQVKS